MKQFARSIPAILFLSVSSLSLIALAGCSSGSGNASTPAGTAVSGIYTIQSSFSGTAETDTVLVYSASSATPTSTLTLPSNFKADAVAVGPQGQIYVGGSLVNIDTNYGEILEFAAGSSGSAKPSVTLNGSAASTSTFTYVNSLAVNSAGTLFVSSDDGTLEAFATGFTSSAAPTQYLTWGTQTDTIVGDPNFGNPNFGSNGGNIGVDTAGDIFFADQGYEVIDVFAAGATAGVAPVRTITGTNTSSFSGLQYIAVNGAGDVYVTNYNQSDDPAFNNDDDGAGMNPGTLAASKRQAMGSHGASPLIAHPHVDPLPAAPTGIIEFAAGATGNATPLNQIGGLATKIVEPNGLAVDSSANVYYADANGGYNADVNDNGVFPLLLLETFSSSATGNVAPTASISPAGFTYGNNLAVTFY
jgi:hypothetical protein